MARILALIASIVVLAVAPLAAVDAVGKMGDGWPRDPVCAYPFLGD